jgi:ribosomal protein S18 acetylase RimI-like enzyme
VRIRPFTDDDLPAAVRLTVETFRPFFADHVRPLYGEELFAAQHGRWQQDYDDLLRTAHAPAARRWVAVADTGATLAGLVAWSAAARPGTGAIDLLAVAPDHRRAQVGRRLCRHAFAALKAEGVGSVEVSTGGDPFHAAARALYESLGFVGVPIVGYARTL